MNQVISTSVGYAPAHITGFFQIFTDGSTGAGLNPKLGATTTVKVHEGAGELQIETNGGASEPSVDKPVLSHFSALLKGCRVSISHQTDYPFCYGMGMSGAIAFSLALALNDALKADKSYAECMEIARRTEIDCGTGLGDVVAQQFSGVMMGLPPYPSMAIQAIACEQSYVTCAFFEPLSTLKIIRDETWKETINRVGADCMRELSADCTFSKFIELSRLFSLETGLASEEVRAVMQKVPQCSMAMLGQTVFLVTDTAAEGMELLSPHSDRVLVSRITDRGASLV